MWPAPLQIRWSCLLVAVAMGIAATPKPCPAGRDQDLVGYRHSHPLARLSLYGGLGMGGVRGPTGRAPAAGRVTFDIGALYNFAGPWRIGAAFNHFRFTQTVLGVETPLELNDVSAFVRIDGREERRLIPYLSMGGGIYFNEAGERGDVYRVAGGLEWPLGPNMLRLEGRYSNYSHGAFLDLNTTSESRQTALGLVVGLRFPLGRKPRAPADGRQLAAMLRRTLSYIATPAEQAALGGVADHELVAFAESFWLRRDPFPELPGNPAQERHALRVVQAQQYGEMGRPGWMTERGRAVIVHGVPDEVIWEDQIPRPIGRRPTTGGLAADTSSASALELWIYYRALPRTTGQQSFFLFKEDAVARYEQVWTNVSGESGFGHDPPPMPRSLARWIGGA